MTSPYLESLNRESRTRYLEKISDICGKDPYSLTKCEKGVEVEHFPEVMFMDIVNYLVYGVSAYTAESFKAFKSLEAYNQFVCGWVNDVTSTKINGLCLVLGKVRHSQRLSEKPLQPWFIASPDGTIKSAHCTCMAGLGESCTHVAALLFFVQDVVMRREEKSVTSVPAYWNQPSKKTVDYLEIKNIDFSTPQSKLESPSSSNTALNATAPHMDDEEFHNVLSQLHAAECGSAILNIVPPFNFHVQDECNLNLKDLYTNSYLQMSLQELQKIANEFVFDVTADEVERIERSTKRQSKSNEWFKYRAGRITASNMKAACVTKLDVPSLTTIKRICYPVKTTFHNKAISWGCNHEKIAMADFTKSQSTQHENFELSNSGLVININYPFLGASPDGLVSCACCGLGCIEIKCPYCVRDCAIDSSLKHACLDNEAGTLRLSKKHGYYFQVQTQIFVTQRQYCDFILWTNNGMHIERIYPDVQFWSVQSGKAESFFKTVLLPEMLGKVFTIPKFVNGLNRNDPIKRPHIVRL